MAQNTNTPTAGKRVFDLSPLGPKHTQSRFITIFSHKGEGKTTTGMGICAALNNTLAALSYDHKTVSVWQNMFGTDARFAVYDAVRYYDPSRERIRETAVDTLWYIDQLLDSFVSAPPDWIMHDGLEVLTVLAEMKMRVDNNLRATEGFSNLNLWKERRMALRHIHKKSIDTAKVGVMYTTYVEHIETISEGEVQSKREVPKWVDAVLMETDIVIKAYANVEKTSIKHLVQVVSSKDDNFMRTGTILDVSDGRYDGLINPTRASKTHPGEDLGDVMGKVKKRE